VYLAGDITFLSINVTHKRVINKGVLICTWCSKGIIGGGKQEGSMSYAKFIPVDLENSPSTEILPLLIQFIALARKF